MTSGCGRFREQIPMAMLGDIGPEAQADLDRHIAECAPCRDEQELYRNTLGHVRAACDVPTPRHFFVYDEPSARTPWWLFRQMPRAWQTSMAAAAIVLAILSTAALTRLRVRVSDGALTVAFGALPSPVPAPPPVDTAALEARLLKAVEQRGRLESAKLLSTLRDEISNSGRKITGQQRALLQTALARVENRVDQNVTGAMAAVQARSDKSIADLYEAVSLQQQRDRSAIENRIDRLAVNGEAKSNQTDAILQTLLEVAELRMK